MNYYRQSIAFFGIILPLLATGLAIGGIFLLKSNISGSFGLKERDFKTYEKTRLGALEIEAKVLRKRDHVKRWEGLLAEETKSAVSNNLRKIQETLPGKEYNYTGTDTLNTPGGFSSASAQKSLQLRLGFRGTYRTVQRAFLELETRMPQLQMQELKIDPNTNQTGPIPMLNFDVTYTAWEK